MFNKSINFMRRLNKENFYFSNLSFQVCWLVKDMEVMKKYMNSIKYAC